MKVPQKVLIAFPQDRVVGVPKGHHRDTIGTPLKVT